MFAARDKDGYLCIYAHKPHRGTAEWSSVDLYKTSETSAVELNRICIDGRLFPELTWEDDPIEVHVC